MSKACGAVAFALFVHLWWRSAGGDLAGPFFIPWHLAPAMAVPWDLALLALFFAAHSGFASLRWKRWLAIRGLDRLGMRRLYLVLTLPVMLVVWVAWVPLARPVLWDAEGVLNQPFLVVRLVALAGLIWTVRSFSLPDFFGDAAAETAADAPAADASAAAPAPRPTVLSTGGAFALCRHPLYFFMTLLAAATTVMPLGRALMAAGLLVYVVIGSRVEERKLEAEFGASYTRYRAQTPWLIPTPRSIARALRPRRRASGV